jgi:hypothetical protein
MAAQRVIAADRLAIDGDLGVVATPRACLKASVSVRLRNR